MLRAGVLLGIRMRDSLSGRCWNPLSGMRWAAPRRVWQMPCGRWSATDAIRNSGLSQGRGLRRGRRKRPWWSILRHSGWRADGPDADAGGGVLVSKFGYTQGILVFTAISSALAGASKVAEPWHGSGAAEQLAVHAPGRGDEETGLEMETVPDSGNPSMNVTEPPDSTPVVPTVRSRSAQNSQSTGARHCRAGSQSPVDKRRVSIRHPVAAPGPGISR